MSLARLFPSGELLLPVPQLTGELGPLLLLVKKGHKTLCLWAAVMTQQVSKPPMQVSAKFSPAISSYKTEQKQ